MKTRERNEYRESLCPCLPACLVQRDFLIARAKVLGPGFAGFRFAPAQTGGVPPVWAALRRPSNPWR